MIPNVAKRGTSFKGAAAYYLHDKKLEGETSRTSSERVAWTETRGIMSDDPDFAIRVMAATAMDKDRLKEAAGVSRAGQKSKGDVYHYSLAWHPDEQGKIDRAEMLQAADQSLKALGADKHQAVIVAHRDEPHPHIHIIVNMVNPENGKNLSVSNDRRKLDKWAHEYRKSRGEENLYCPKRTQKHKAIEAKKQGQSVDFVRGEKSIPRSIEADFSKLGQAANQNEKEVLLKEQREHDLKLSAYGRKMASKHKNEWAALSDNYQLQKKHISAQFKKDKAHIRDSVHERMKPLFAELYRKQHNERYIFKQREKRLGGKIKNAIEAVTHAQAFGRGDSSFLGMVFSFTANRGRREMWLERKHNAAIRELRADQAREVKSLIGDLRSTRDQKLKAARGLFNVNREALIAKQKIEKYDLRERWKIRSDRKKRAIQTLEKKGRIRNDDDATLTQDEVVSAKAQFRKKTAERRQGRTRSRKRIRDNDE